MEQLKEKFPSYTPNYVLDEIAYYFKKTSSGKLDVFTLDNAISLVNLAIVNERISEEQGKVIKNQIQDIKKNQDN